MNLAENNTADIGSETGIVRVRAALARSVNFYIDPFALNYRERAVEQEKFLPILKEFVACYWVEDEFNLLPETVTKEKLARFREDIQLGDFEQAYRGANRLAFTHQRFYIWFQERGRCAYCETEVSPLAAMQPDHIEPFDGSNTVTQNLVCSCTLCNVAKGVMPALEFAELIAAPEGISHRDELVRQQSKGFFIRDFKNKHGYVPSEEAIRLMT